MTDDLAARRARCIYCDHAYEYDPPGQWATLCHLADCRPLPRDIKPGLFHEAMAVALRLRAEADQERAARQAAEARGEKLARCIRHMIVQVEEIDDLGDAVRAMIEAGYATLHETGDG